MSTYVVLTRLTPEAVKTPGELKRLMTTWTSSRLPMRPWPPRW